MKRYILFLFFVFPIFLAAQSLHYKNITTEDGLASSECYKIIQDRQGYMWICTDAGLCRYNGKEFKTFTTDDGLPSNTIFEIMEDRYGRIWGGCFYGGIFYIHHDSVYNIGANPELRRRSNENKEMIRKLVLDQQNILHVGTTKNYYRIGPENDYGKILEYPKVDSSFTLLKSLGNELFFTNIAASIGYGSSWSKHVIESAHQTYIVYPFYGRRQAMYASYFALSGSRNNILFALANLLYDYNYRSLSKKVFDQNIIYMYLDQEKNLWIGFFKEGFLMYPGADLSANPIQGLSENAVGGFCQDKEGGMWFSTLNKGIFYCPNPRIFSFDELDKKNIPAISTHQGQIFIGSADHQVWMLQEDHLQSLFEWKGNIQVERIFFAEAGGSMYKTGGHSARFDKKGNYDFIVIGSEAAIPVVQVLQIRDTLWGINHEMLMQIRNNKASYEDQLPSRGFCMYYTSKKEFMIGCIDGLYEYRQRKFIKIPLVSQSENIRISFVVEDPFGNLVLSTKSHGVFIRKGGHWININQSHGLASNLCNHVLCSEDGVYYVSTNKGLSIINTHSSCLSIPNTYASFRIENINISNGLPANEINMVAEHEGKLYIATENGLCYYDKKYPVFNFALPPLVIPKITLTGNELVNTNTYPFYQNDLYFRCDVLSYQSPRLNKIKYQLLPVDKAPRYSQVFDINYDNLSPGSYTLVIQGVNNNGVEGLPSIYRFTIRSPFWSTWWFILFGSMFLVLTTYILVRKRIGYIRRRESEKTALKEKIVEFHYTALRAQMNPHFIFNVINSIQLYVLKNQPKEAYNYLSKFSKLIRNVLQNSKEKLISLVNELETIQLYTELEQIRLEDNVSFKIHVDEKIDTSNVLVPSMIIQPVLENAIWHGIVPLNGTRKGKVDLSIFTKNNQLVILVRDNGIGIDLEKEKEKERTSFGLSLIRDRLSLLSDQSNIEIANLLNDQNEVQGVEVTITMPIILKN